MKKQQKYYWKVVRKVDGKYASAVIRRGRYCLNYKIGKITESNVPESGIFCYTCREYARNHKRYFDNNDVKILKVIPTGKEIDSPTVYDYDALEGNRKVKSLWSAVSLGTICFSAVKVIGIAS